MGQDFVTRFPYNFYVLLQKILVGKISVSPIASSCPCASLILSWIILRKSEKSLSSSSRIKLINYLNIATRIEHTMMGQPFESRWRQMLHQRNVKNKRVALTWAARIGIHERINLNFTCKIIWIKYWLFSNKWTLSRN